MTTDSRLFELIDQLTAAGARIAFEKIDFGGRDILHVVAHKGAKLRLIKVVDSVEQTVEVLQLWLRQVKA